MGQPGRVQGVIVWAATVFAKHPLAAGLAVGLVEIALASAILYPGTRRAGLACSIPWALCVWAFGEGFGGVFSQFSMLPSGAPGAALLYALAAIMLLPRSANITRARGVDSPARFGLLGDRGSASVWGVLWLGAALMQVIPVVTLGFKLSANFEMKSLGEPDWLATLDRTSKQFASGHGVVLTAVLVIFELTVAAAALVDGIWRTRLVTFALIALPVLWIVGENFGGLLTGSATDLGAMPLYILLGIGLRPLRGARARNAARQPIRHNSRQLLAVVGARGDATVATTSRMQRPVGTVLGKAVPPSHVSCGNSKYLSILASVGALGLVEQPTNEGEIMNPDPRALNELLEQSQDLQADALRPTREGLDEFVDASNSSSIEDPASNIAFHEEQRQSLLTSFAGATLLGAAGGIALVGALASAASATSSTDVQLLQTAASIENLAVATYKTALTLPYIGGSSANAVVTKFCRVTLSQHREHADAFNAALKALNAPVQLKPDPAFVPVVDKAVKSLSGVSAAKGTVAVVGLAIELENIAAATYVRDTVLTNSRTNRALFASIMGVEAQHVAVLLAVQALLKGGAPQLISLAPGTAAKLPGAAGSVGFPNAFFKTNSAAPATQGAVK